MVARFVKTFFLPRFSTVGYFMQKTASALTPQLLLKKEKSKTSSYLLQTSLARKLWIIDSMRGVYLVHYSMTIWINNTPDVHRLQGDRRHQFDKENFNLRVSKKLDWLLIQFQWKIKSNWSMCPRLSGTCWIVRVFAVEWKFSCLRAGRLGKGDWEGARDNSELELGDHQQWQDQCYIRLCWSEWGCFGLYPCLFSFMMRPQW